MLKHRVKGHTKVLCKVTKFFSSLLPWRQSALLCSSHVIPNVWAEDEVYGDYSSYLMVKRQENKDSACSWPEWQVQHHPGKNTQKCTSGVSVPVITAWRRHLKSQWHAFLLHLNVCAPSSFDTIRWGPCLSDRLCLLCLISPEYRAAAAAQLHAHREWVK